MFYIRGRPIRSGKEGRTRDHYDFNRQRKFLDIFLFFIFDNDHREKIIREFADTEPCGD